MKAKVVIIDDNKRELKDHAMALAAASYEVVWIPNTAGLNSILTGSAHQDATFFIVDIMMPPGDLYKKEAVDFEFTGLFVARDLRRKFTHVPIILWTWATKEEIVKAARKQETTILACRYAKKSEVPPSELVKELDYYLKRRKFRSRILKLVWSTLRNGFSVLKVGETLGKASRIVQP